MKIKIHSFANFLPFATDEEYRKIRDDIKENGLRVPLLLFNGELLDGRTRLRACQDLGIPPSFDHFRGSSMEALRHVQSLNVYRRHLDQGQKAVAASRIAEELKRCQRMTIKEATAAAAKATGASVSSTRKAAAIDRDDPELANAVLNGDKTLEQADRERRPVPPRIQSKRYLSTAIMQIHRSLGEMKRRRCPEQKRLESLLQELQEIHANVTTWANTKA